MLCQKPSRGGGTGVGRKLEPPARGTAGPLEQASVELEGEAFKVCLYSVVGN